MRTAIPVATLIGWIGWIAPYAHAQIGQSVIDTVHNLSVSGPGSIRATSEQEICVFCHTPHDSAPVSALWNRNELTSAYTIYSSSSLDALPDQPTGSSKLCLSCHDGTIALGDVLSRSSDIPITGGISTLPAGSSNLGTDLSDDHPISFPYDTRLTSSDPHLRPAGQLPDHVPLDGNREMQCITCHDPHDNSFGDFLVMNNDNAALCKTCHLPGGATITGHENCNSCHQVHTSPSGPLLLSQANVRGTCLECHDGSQLAGGAQNIAPDLNKISVHDTDSPADLIDNVTEHVGCSDCHQPHTIGSGEASAPTIPPNFGEIDGVNLSGTTVERASFEYEVCFKCHSDDRTVLPWSSRLITQSNTRLEFEPNAVSFHPVTAIGKNTDVPSLVSGWDETSRMYCTDCHNSDTGAHAGGGGPDGPHGSNIRSLLIDNYNTNHTVTESPEAYALCYRCHSRTNILDDRTFAGHREHIVDANTSCSACHDPHGISSVQGNSMNNSHLINFDTNIVTDHNGKLEFVDLGFRRSECTLTCHGVVHDRESYED
ncbi:MAG: cytochrome c3 family protein [Planctomycetota bacterium]|jgi:predicted CXXCH cytochrome family protein